MAEPCSSHFKPGAGAFASFWKPPDFPVSWTYELFVLTAPSKSSMFAAAGVWKHPTLGESRPNHLELAGGGLCRPNELYLSFSSRRFLFM